MTVKTNQASLSTSGQASFYTGNTDIKQTHQTSGIYVKEGINHDGTTFTVNELNSKGGKIITDGVNNFIANQVHAEEVHDSVNHQGYGASLNVHDLQRLTSEESAPYVPGQKAVATASVALENKEFKAYQETTIFGHEGTH